MSVDNTLGQPASECLPITEEEQEGVRLHASALGGMQITCGSKCRSEVVRMGMGMGMRMGMMMIMMTMMVS